jgi:hypothetical protein
MRKIQQKASLLKGNMPDDVILQVFIEQLSEKVTLRKTELRHTQERAQEQMDFEETIKNYVQNARGELVDNDTLTKVYTFLQEQKPKIDSMETQISALKANK